MEKNVREMILNPAIETIAIVGCSKNSGKTSTLNALLDVLKEESLKGGVMSIGIDGEEADLWLGVPKPSIALPRGFLVASAEKALKSGTLSSRIISRTNIRTALGELVVARVEKEGTLLLAGVRHKKDIRLIQDIFKKYAVGKILIDGSYQRAMAADPEVSDAVILATGAILGRSVKEVAKKTAEVMRRFLFETIDNAADKRLVSQSSEEGNPVFRRKGGKEVVSFSKSSAQISEPEIKRAFIEGDIVVAVPGVLTDRFLKGCLAYKKGRVAILLTDPTRCVASGRLVDRFFENGGRISVLKNARLAAISVNPSSVLGYTLPAKSLLKAIEKISGGVPVFLLREK